MLPPRPDRKPFVDPNTVLAIEIAQEQASTLGRLGRALEAALAALRAHDAEVAAAPEPAPAAREQRTLLVAEAATVLWHFVIQRESVGLRDAARVMQDYGVPAEVRNRMGVIR